MARTVLSSEEIAAKTNATTYREIGSIALTHLYRIQKNSYEVPIVEVCGPITSGGAGSVAENLFIFETWISKLSISPKRIVFDQLPFEEDLFRIRRRVEPSLLAPSESLLNSFYLPIFQSGVIRKLYFIPGWSSSFGCLWEHRQAVRLNIPIDYL